MRLKYQAPVRQFTTNQPQWLNLTIVTHNNPGLSYHTIAQATTLAQHRPDAHQMVLMINSNLILATASSKVPFYNTAFINN